MCILLFDVFSSIKEKNRLIRKGMCVDVKHLLLRKTDVLKTSIFSERKIEGMYKIRRAKWYKVYSAKRLFCHHRLRLFFVYNPCLRFLLICLAWR